MRTGFLLRALWLGSLCGLSGGALAAGKCERLVATGDAESPPYLWVDPQHPRHLIGASADLLQQLGHDLGLEIEVLSTGSWASAQDEVRSGRADLLVDTPLSMAQLEQLDYIHPPLWMSPSVVWVRRGQAFTYGSWEDLRGHTGASALNSSFGPAFDAFAKDNLTIEAVPSLAQAFQTLLLGHRDYVLAPRYLGQAQADGLALTAELEVLQPPIRNEALYLALSHNSACNDGWLRGQLAKKMTELLAAGLPEALLQRNLARWQAQQQPSANPAPPAGAPNQ